MLKAVLDTNILVSGTTIPKGNPFSIVKAWKEGHFILVTAPQLIQEVLEVLNRPYIRYDYNLTDVNLSNLVKALSHDALVVEGLLEIPRVARDPDDDQILACAKEGRADYIVTGDQGLLNLKRYEGIPIVTPKAFLAILKAARRASGGG